MHLIKFNTLSLQKPGIEVINLNIIKSIFENPTINITLNGEKLKISLLRSGRRQGCSLSTLLVNTVLEGLARTIK